MTIADAGYYLDSFLAPLAPMLERTDVTDIWINRPGEVWVESLGGGIERIVEPSLDERLLTRGKTLIDWQGKEADCGLFRARD